MPRVSTGVTMVPADRLKPHPKNPRLGDVAAIREAIALNGWHGVLVVQESTDYILAGNHRFLAGTSLSEYHPEGFDPLPNMERFPVMYRDVDEETALKILLADNRTSDVATYNDPMLLELFAQIGDPETAAKILSDPDSTEAERAEAIRALASTAPAARFAGTGYTAPAVQQIALGLDGGAAVDAGARGNKELDRERWATIDVRQIGLVMDEAEFNRAVAVLLFIREEEGFETNTEAVLWLLDRYNTEHDGKPAELAETKGATDDDDLDADS